MLTTRPTRGGPASGSVSGVWHTAHTVLVTSAVIPQARHHRTGSPSEVWLLAGPGGSGVSTAGDGGTGDPLVTWCPFTLKLDYVAEQVKHRLFGNGSTVRADVLPDWTRPVG
jgi:hypothetical protein